MTEKDRTGDQLVASIRKSKAGVVAQKTATRSTKARPAAAGRARAVQQAPAHVAEQLRYDSGYSFGRRVWPD